MSKSLIILTALLLCLSTTAIAASDEQSDAQNDMAIEDMNAQPPAKTKPAKPIELKPPKPHEYYYNADIDHYFNPDKLKPLLAGDTEFYALMQEDMTGRPKGVALLLPDWSQSATAAQGLAFLRTKLPEYGWVTLAMNVPQSQQPVFNTGPAQSLSNPEPVPADAEFPEVVAAKPDPARMLDEAYMQQYELMLKMRMQALIDEAQNYPGYFIVIAQGSSAAVLASLYARAELPEPQAMILLSAMMPDYKLTQKMNLDIAQNPIPTLDIYQSRGFRWAKENAMKRKQLAKKYFKPIYRNKELYGDISYHNQNHRLLRTIHNWLGKLGL